MFLLTKLECAALEDINWHPTPIHGQPLQIPKYQYIRREHTKEKTFMWGTNLFLKKTMSEKPYITKYALRNSLPDNANIQKIL